MFMAVIKNETKFSLTPFLPEQVEPSQVEPPKEVRNALRAQAKPFVFQSHLVETELRRVVEEPPETLEADKPKATVGLEAGDTLPTIT
jgi:hypothetical protein